MTLRERFNCSDAQRVLRRKTLGELEEILRSALFEPVHELVSNASKHGRVSLLDGYVSSFSRQSGKADRRNSGLCKGKLNV